VIELTGSARDERATIDWSIHRPNTVEVDVRAIVSNTRIVRRLVGPGVTVFAAVKGNGYGLGISEVSKALLAGGADGFTLADPQDALRIRRGGIGSPILLYGGIAPSRDTVRALEGLDLMCTVTDLSSAQAYSDLAATPLRVFAKIDVGLERLGTYAERGVDFVKGVSDLPGLSLQGVYTHVHNSSDMSYLDWQLDRFDHLLADLEAARIHVPLRMAESSASVGLKNRQRLNAVDPGHLLYGILPAGRSDLPVGLRPALRALKTQVIQVKSIERSAFRDQAPIPVRDGMRIGIIPIGRGDGLHRLSAGHVLIRNQLVPIVGRLSLEHARIDLTDVPDAKAGDEVLIIDGSGTELSAQGIAEANQLDAVGLLLEMRSTIRRVYV
jgi:alanine racemase